MKQIGVGELSMRITNGDADEAKPRVAGRHAAQLPDSFGVRDVQGGVGSVTVPRPGRSPVKVTVAPFHMRPGEEAPWFGETPAAIVTILDPDAACERKLQSWRERFGLMPAEARFALEIVRGGRRAAAARFGISDSTAKTHLTNIFAKTGSSRQLELVALLLGDE